MVQAVAWAEWGGALSTDIMKNDCMKNTERQTTRSATTAAVAILSDEIIRLYVVPSAALAAVLAGTLAARALSRLFFHNNIAIL